MHERRLGKVNASYTAGYEIPRLLHDSDAPTGMTQLQHQLEAPVD